MIDIVLCADEKYAPYAAVVMVSALSNTSHPEKVCFYLLTTGLDFSTQRKLQKMVADKGGLLVVIEAEFTHVDLRNLGRFGKVSLLRLYMHKYLPESCSRVIYFDCDLVILGDVGELWKTSLDGKLIGAVQDLCNPRQLALRGKAKKDNYFNSGVMLVDLDKWRNNLVGERALDYIVKSDVLSFPDQDALNYVIDGQWANLPFSWNFQPTAYAAIEKRYAHYQHVRHELEDAIRNPNIIHFIGNTKPWHSLSMHPLQEVFVDYSLHTPWPIDLKELRKELSIKQRLRLAVKKLKILRRKRKTLRYTCCNEN